MKTMMTHAKPVRRKAASRVLLARGILTWEGGERRSNRYGSIMLISKSYDGTGRAKVEFCQEEIARTVGMRVRMTCDVVRTRKSDHLGDQVLKIFPSTPEAGETIDLGVGWFESRPGFDGSPELILRPGDGRSTLWIDPRKLYRLHDQTVKVYVEVTSEKFSEAPDIQISNEPEVMATRDGFYQVKNLNTGHMFPKIVPLGDGAFRLDTNFEVGESIPFRKTS